VVPNLDGVVDPVWARATELKVVVDGSFLDVATTGAEVTLKFLYTDENIYMLAQWPDPTYSIAKYEAWLWEGAGWHTLVGSAAELEAGLTAGKSETGEFVSDDGLGVKWEINAPEFEEKGCITQCHVGWKGEVDVSPPHWEGEYSGACRTCHGADELMWQQSGHYFDTDKEAILDLWLMRAIRVMPLGYSDDFSLVYDAAPHTTMGGRKSDHGIRPYFFNRNRDQTAPLYMEKNPTSYYDAMVIFESEIAKGEAVAVAGLTDEQISEYWANYQALRVGVATNYPKALVTARVLNDLTLALTPTDFRPSRHDVLLFAKWSAVGGGMWTAEYARKLVTGYTDDVQFDDFTAYYPFDIAVFDNTRGEGHSYHVGTPLHLVFAPPVVGEPMPVVEEPTPVVDEPTAPGALPPIKFWLGDTNILIEGGDLTPYGSGLTSLQEPPWTMTVEKDSTIPLTLVRNTIWYSNMDHNLTIEGTTIDIYVPLGADEGPFEVTFDEVGTFKVYCSLHPDDHGETLILVTEEGEALPPEVAALPPIQFKLGDEYIQFVGDDLAPYGSGLSSPLDSRDGPWTITVEKGSTISITEVSTSGKPGTLDHNLTIEETTIDVYLSGGETAGPFEVTFDEVGTFKVYCSLHPDEVHGTIVVEE
jgi:plastocyanin